MQTATTKDKKRRRRKGGGELTGKRLGVAKSKLDFNKFAYRWVNDNPGRIHAMTVEDDWDFVPNDNVKDDDAGRGSAVTQVVGVSPDGSPLLAYLCRKPRTYFDEDQADKAKELDEQLAQLRRGNTRDGAKQSDYTPNVGISVGRG